MKFLRVGEKGKEIIAALDGEKKIKDLSSHIKDLNPDTINFENLDRLKNNPVIITKEQLKEIILNF